MQEEARTLRAAGFTMPASAERLGVSRSSVSLWTRDVPLTPGADWGRPADRQPRRSNALQRRKQEEIDRLLAEAGGALASCRTATFLVAGAALYAGEGGKGDGKVTFSNSDPRMTQLFCRWLRHFFEVDETRLRVRLYLHEGLDLDAATLHWSRAAGVPTSQFGAAYRAVPDPTIRKAKHVHGCATVSYACSRTHWAVMGIVHAVLTAE